MQSARSRAALLHVSKGETPSLEECSQRVRAVLETAGLPPPHRLLLQHLSRHFCRLGQNSSWSRPAARALGELLGELLFHAALTSTEVNPEHHAKIIEALVLAGGTAERDVAPGLENTTSAQRFPRSLRSFPVYFVYQSPQ
ncbi:hypothetical protein Y1Q_0003612 [Alligator mississippiensis]|uniref:Rho-GAP domain-containing protein n=1 Tax=Alligator mississippiensis TaxID=8496 RepID=A0A151PG99_ALLMI|nr:hypothetical protein Y1Q_0003612 [Alligator mississippiensis]